MTHDPGSELKRRIADQRVPESLQQELHDARLRFHAARVALEAAMSDDQYRHQERLNEKEEALHRAEKDLEAISAKVQEILDRPL